MTDETTETRTPTTPAADDDFPHFSFLSTDEGQCRCYYQTPFKRNEPPARGRKHNHLLYCWQLSDLHTTDSPLFSFYRCSLDGEPQNPAKAPATQTVFPRTHMTDGIGKMLDDWIETDPNPYSLEDV